MLGILGVTDDNTVDDDKGLQGFVGWDGQVWVVLAGHGRGLNLAGNGLKFGFLGGWLGRWVWTALPADAGKGPHWPE